MVIESKQTCDQMIIYKGVLRDSRSLKVVFSILELTHNDVKSRYPRLFRGQRVCTPVFRKNVHAIVLKTKKKKNLFINNNRYVQ